MARPCVLDDAKQREVCALVTAGMSLTKIADYVGCDRRTIQRLRKTDEEFDERMRRAAMAQELSPLQTLRNASKTHWRAAAYLLDRQDRREAEQRTARERRRVAPNLQGLARAVKQAVAEKVGDPVTELVLQQAIDEIFCSPESAEKQAKRNTRRQQAPSVPSLEPWPVSHPHLASEGQQPRAAAPEDDILEDEMDTEHDEDLLEEDIHDEHADDDSFEIDRESLVEWMAEVRREVMSAASEGFAAAADNRAQQLPDWPAEGAAKTSAKAGSNERREAT